MVRPPHSLSFSSSPSLTLSLSLLRYITYFDQRLGNHRSLLQLKYAEQMLDGNEKIYQKTLRQHEHRVQAMVMEFERLINVGALKDVTTTVTSLMLCHVVEQLMARGYPEPEQRMLNRIVIQSRVLCVLDRMHEIFFDRGSPVGSALSKKRHIELQDFKQLDRTLFTTREHTVAAIGEMHDLLIDPADAVVRRGLSHMLATGASAASSGRRTLYRQRAMNSSVSAMYNTPKMIDRLLASKAVRESCAHQEANDVYLVDGPLPPPFSTEHQAAVAQATASMPTGSSSAVAGKPVVRIPPMHVPMSARTSTAQTARPPEPSLDLPAGTFAVGAGGGGPGLGGGASGRAFGSTHRYRGGSIQVGAAGGPQKDGPEDFIFDYNYARFGVETTMQHRYGGGAITHARADSARQESQFYTHLAASIASMPDNRIQPTKEQCKRVLTRWTQQQLTAQPYGQLWNMDLWEKEVQHDLQGLWEEKARMQQVIDKCKQELARLGPALEGEGEDIVRMRIVHEVELQQARNAYRNILRRTQATTAFIEQLGRHKLQFEGNFGFCSPLPTAEEARELFPGGTDEGFLPLTLYVAEFDGRNLYVATAWLANCDLKEPEQVLEARASSFFLCFSSHSFFSFFRRFYWISLITGIRCRAN
jgi:hypothetical protein